MIEPYQQPGSHKMGESVIQIFNTLPIIIREANFLDIAALSMNMNQASLSQNVSIALTKISLDNAQQNAAQMIDMLQGSHPTLGHIIDLKG
jgi:hypothetical protein